MKLCKDCQHYTNSTLCVSPANGPSPIDGQPQPRFAVLSRKYDCGPEALWFTPKQVKIEPWYKRIFK